MTNNKKSRNAFTIVELVIVIAVISILAAVLIPTFAFMIKRAEESRDLQESENQAKEDFAESMLGTDEPDNIGDDVPDNTPRLEQDSSWIIHADMVPVLKPTSVDFVLVYYLNRTEQNAEVFEAVMKDSSVWLGYQIDTNNADTWGGEQKVLFADQKGVDGYYADCFEPQSVVLRSVPLDEFENDTGYFSFSIHLDKSGSTDNMSEGFISVMLMDHHDYTKDNGEPKFDEQHTSPLRYYSENVTAYYNEIKSSS